MCMPLNHDLMFAGGVDNISSAGDDFLISCNHPADCVYEARENTTVVVPCGKYDEAPGISFTYYLKGSLKMLVKSTLDFPRFTLSWRDDGTTICCAPNTSSSTNFFQDSTCYFLNVTCETTIIIAFC